MGFKFFILLWAAGWHFCFLLCSGFSIEFLWVIWLFESTLGCLYYWFQFISFWAWVRAFFVIVTSLGLLGKSIGRHVVQCVTVKRQNPWIHDHGRPTYPARSPLAVPR